MAKWGEGDPRWLVEHRDDGKNVNGWHWEEKGKLEWSRARLGELLSGAMVEGVDSSKASITFQCLKELTGEASITIRKGNKKFAVFDLTLTAGWEATVPGSDKPVKGSVKVEEIHSTGDEDDYIYSVSVEGAGQEQELCKSLMGSQAVKAQVFSLIAAFIADLQQQQ